MLVFARLNHNKLDKNLENKRTLLLPFGDGLQCIQIGKWVRKQMLNIEMQGFHPQSSAKEGPSVGSGAVLTSRTTTPQLTQNAQKLPHNIGPMHSA